MTLCIAGTTLRQPTVREAVFLLPPLPRGQEQEDSMGPAPGMPHVSAGRIWAADLLHIDSSNVSALC